MDTTLLRRDYSTALPLGCTFGKVLGLSATRYLCRNHHRHIKFLLLELQHGRLSQALLFFWLVGLAGILKIARAKETGMGHRNWFVCNTTSPTYWYRGLFCLAACPIWIFNFGFGTRNAEIFGGALLTTLVICLPYVFALTRLQ